MNQVQRKYLIDKIQANTQEAVKRLKESMPKKPDLSTHCLNALLNGNLHLKSEDEIMHLLRQRALNGGRNVFSDSFSRYEETEVKFKFEEVFTIPESYIELYNVWEEKRNKIQEQIDTLQMQSEGLCTRIQLASNKTLEKMIAEVDNMGDITFMDCTLKSLMTKSEHNLID